MDGAERIEELAGRLELALELLGVRWSAVADNERSAVIGRIEATAPGIARMLCPQLGRYAIR